MKKDTDFLMMVTV